jgi:hypothetical protein
VGHTDRDGITYGIGNANCSVISQPNGALAFEWTEGFITAGEGSLTAAWLTERNQIWQWPVVTTDNLEQWTVAYCRQHPEATVGETAFALMSHGLVPQVLKTTYHRRLKSQERRGPHGTRERAEAAGTEEERPESAEQPVARHQSGRSPATPTQDDQLLLEHEILGDHRADATRATQLGGHDG